MHRQLKGFRLQSSENSDYTKLNGLETLIDFKSSEKNRNTLSNEVKKDLLRVLGSEDIGMTLTESMAMNPASSVSGFYLAHPEARYFNVGKVSEDQLADLALRRGEAIEDVRRQLSSSLD